MIERLSALGLDPRPSAGNFVLLRFTEEEGRSAESALADLKKNGILVRAMGGYGLPACLRITVGTETETRAVVGALEGFVARCETGAGAQT
jgi:histidinol-phosphate aminotransferase